MVRIGLLLLLMSPCVAAAQREFGFDNRKASGQPYLKPEESVARMKIADGFEVKLFAAEPQLANPIAMTVDEKGRVWVVECFEYPSRTQKGKMPRDRIKVLEDTDGDGVCDKVTVFAEGKDFPRPFDLASGIEVGNGGVYLGAPPYLWFLQDTNGDGKADRFDILLEGFGSQDTHETLNTFNWGPDGKLYGLHGVFTQSDVKNAQADGPVQRMNAALWNYDPHTRQFRTFAEGTSNPWGCDYRNGDGQYILACCVIPHLFHLSPGGIYKRQAGQSYNPYAFSYLPEICDHTFHKESGWAHAGLISLDTPLMPEAWRNSVIFGSIHGTSIKRNVLAPNGSTYKATRGDDFLQSLDKNFRPINLRWGPNGEIYCIDWHDQNPCHQAAADAWDYERGRVYRFQTRGLKTQKPQDLGALPESALRVMATEDANPYRRRTALRLLTERAANPSQRKEPTRQPLPPKLDTVAGLLAAHAESPLNKLSAADASKLLDASIEAPPEVRGWLCRLLLEGDKAEPRVLSALAARAARERSPVVRRDMASAVLRHTRQPESAELLHQLLSRSEDAKDPVIPQLLWLGFESRLVSQITPELEWLKSVDPKNALVTTVIVPRAMRRLVATGKAEDLERAIAFILETKDATVRLAALQGLAEATQNRQVDAPPSWKKLQAELAQLNNPEVQSLASRLGVSFRDREAIERALKVVRSADAPRAARVEAIRALASAKPREALEPLLLQAGPQQTDPEIRQESIRALSAFDSPEVPRQLLGRFKELSPALRNETVSLLASRKEWAKELLAAVGENTVARTELTDNIITRIQGFNDAALNGTVEKVWGRLRKTPAELEAVIQKMRGELYATGASFERGRKVYENNCAKCHVFDGKGYEVGPNIEGAGRDVEYLLANILDPNRVIGAPYFMRTVFLDSGVSHAGVLVGEDDQTLTLKTENAVLKTFNKKEIEKVLVQEKSLMPEGLANTMTVQDFRDLVRYVMANPFLTEVRVGSGTPAVAPNGRIALPDSGEVEVTARVQVKEATRVRLMLGVAGEGILRVNDQAFPVRGGGKADAPDQANLEVSLAPGVNTLSLRYTPRGKGEAAYLRLVDPDRKVNYLSAEEVKK